MKTTLLFSAFLFLLYSGFCQNIDQNSKKEIEQLQTSIKNLQNKNALQKAEIKKLETLLIDNQIKQDSAFGLIDNTNSKATESLLSLSDINTKIDAINKSAKNRALRIHQGKINLIIILSIMSFGILTLFVFLYFRQLRVSKRIKESFEKFDENISIRIEKINDANLALIEQTKNSLNLRTAELHKTALEKIENLKSVNKHEIESLNKKVNEKLLYLDSNHELLSDKIIESQKFNILELEKTKTSFDSLIVSNSSMIDARLKKSEAMFKNELEEMKKSTEALCKKMIADNKNVLKTVEIFKKKRDNIKT